MFIPIEELSRDLPRIEEIEKASARLVAQAIYDFRMEAADIYRNERDLKQDIGEDITREALDRIGVSRIGVRLFGKIDYKRARYVFHPDYAVKQALFVDSKAEKAALGVARVQTAQTSMRIQLPSPRGDIDEQGSLPTVFEDFLTTTIFVKYHYAEVPAAAGMVVEEPSIRFGGDGDGEPALEGRRNTELVKITVAALPNGLLQERYNPTTADNIWNVGPHAPARGERFRVRLSFAKLKAKANWRVQRIPLAPAQYVWED